MWKQLTLDLAFPQSLTKFLEDNDCFRFNGGIYLTMIWYKGETPETATGWLVVMDDGVNYKHNAKFIYFFTRPDNRVGSQCAWSSRHLDLSIDNFIKTGKTLVDPDYET